MLVNVTLSRGWIRHKIYPVVHRLQCYQLISCSIMSQLYAYCTEQYILCAVSCSTLKAKIPILCITVLKFTLCGILTW